MLDSLLRREDRGVEFGSGSSTRWLGLRSSQLISVESDPTWYSRVAEKTSDLASVDLRVVSDASADAYVAGVADIEQVDFVMDDGWHRGAVALWAIDHLRPGGLLVVDDTHWFLPFAPHATCIDYSGAPDFEEVVDRTQGWRRLWGSTGYTDTTIWIKP